MVSACVGACPALTAYFSSSASRREHYGQMTNPRSAPNCDSIRRHMLIFVVARSRLDRYDELRRQFADWTDVRIVLDRREGDRRKPHPSAPGTDRRRADRRRIDLDAQSYVKLGWSVIDTEERGA